MLTTIFKLHAKNHLLNIYHYSQNRRKGPPGKIMKSVKKRKDLHKAIQLKDSQISSENQLTFNKTKEELPSAYKSEQIKYVNRKIKVIEIAAANKQSSIACKIVNEISGRMNSNSAQL